MTEQDLQAHKVIDAAIEQYAPKKVFALFSGGHDSLTVTHLTSKHPAFSGVIHINTGIGIPQTNQFVRDTCAEQGWTLHELHPPERYIQMIVRTGFPGPDAHPWMYRRLKERALMQFVKTQKTHRMDKIAFCGETRSQESVRRMGTVQVMSQQGAVIWVAPIHDWTAIDTTDYIHTHGLKRNPVKDRLHISGECLCGCFADRLERREIAYWYPEVDAELTKYEEIVSTVARLRPGDITVPEQRCQWGWANGLRNEQMELFPLCHFCHAGREKVD